MSSPKIEKILERYFQGESSLQEEQSLREFFSQDKLPAHLAELKDQFMMFGGEAGRELPGSFDDRLFEMISEKERDTRLSRRRVIFYVSGIAATVLVMVSLFIRFDPFLKPSAGNPPEAEAAFEQASRILYFVSDKFNQGAAPLGKVARFDQGMQDMSNVKKFDEGLKKTAPASRFNQITNLITNQTQ